LAVHISEAAIFVRRLLRHPDFNSHSKRAGKVARVSSGGISYWTINETRERRVAWKPERSARASR
jgi:hypothetical protein